MSDQALLFQQAGMVVAPHGAGLANMVFAPPGLRVIELLPDGVMNWCYRHLAAACGHDYDCVIGRSAPGPEPGASRLWSGWTVSATHVLSAVECGGDQTSALSCQTIASATTPPPINDATDGTSPNASHTHSGTNGISSVLISMACPEGTRAAPER